MGTLTEVDQLFERADSPVQLNNRRKDWREAAVDAALNANIHYGDGQQEFLRHIRQANPDGHTYILNVDRDELLRFLTKHGEVETLVTATTTSTDYGIDAQCAGWYRTCWEGESVEIAFSPSTSNYGIEICIGRCIESLKRLANRLTDETIRPRGRALRFNKHWEQAPDIDAELGKVQWKDIVLDQQLMTGIRESVESFFAQREVYRSLGFSWRRGILLVGPPGTGKTMICKAIAASQPTLPLLYVRDIQDERGCNSEEPVKVIFNRARKLAPCLLAFEDIDGMLTGDRRTVFLNELDGFKNNEGLFVIASSNHPGKIDEALLQRPSRFDRVFHVGLPAQPERVRFCKMLMERESIKGNLTPGFDTQAVCDQAGQLTDGFTLAYLKEAFISAALSRAQAGVTMLDDHFAKEVIRQIEILGAYIKKAKNPDSWADMRSGLDKVGFR